LTLVRAARALAALDGDLEVGPAHLRRMAPSALRHRLRRNPLDETVATTRVEKALAGRGLDPSRAVFLERAKHADELDAMVGGWIATHSLDQVMREFEAAEAAVAPIYDIRHIMADPQFQALKTIIPVEDPELGPIKMQNVMFRMSETPGSIKWTGRKPGADNADVYGRMLGLDEPRMADLKARGVI